MKGALQADCGVSLFNDPRQRAREGGREELKQAVLWTSVNFGVFPHRNVE